MAEVEEDGWLVGTGGGGAEGIVVYQETKSDFP